MNSKQIGNIGVMKVATRFMELGYEVFIELGDNSDIDLIVVNRNELKRIQVKTTYCVKNQTMVWEIAKRRLNYNQHRVEFYDDYIDGFGLYCAENNYIGYIDKQDVTSKYSITFRLSNCKHPTPTTKLAKDYLL